MLEGRKPNHITVDEDRVISLMLRLIDACEGYSRIEVALAYNAYVGGSARGGDVKAASS
jgi:hypothetical protein